MSSYHYFVADAFTQTPFTGNPAGVVLHDGGLTGDQMRAIAGELKLETAFLVPEGEAQYRVAYYTGAQRIPLCGHDTVAAATALALTGRMETPGSVTFLTDVGPLPVAVGRDGAVTMTLDPPRSLCLAPPGAAAAALCLGADALDDRFPLEVLSLGTPFLFVALKSRAVLNVLSPDMARLAAYTAALPGDVAGLYAWTTETVSPKAAIHARCFAPGVGLPEDPVTGSASGALGPSLVWQGYVPLRGSGATGAAEFLTEQGHAMGRPGGARVRVETARGECVRVQVGGHAVLIAEGRLWG